jgi:hypothetical protein
MSKNGVAIVALALVGEALNFKDMIPPNWVSLSKLGCCVLGCDPIGVRSRGPQRRGHKRKKNRGM